MASGPRASLPVLVVEVMVSALVASVVAFLVEVSSVKGSSVGGSSIELPPNWAGYLPLLTGWVETPPVLGTSTSTNFLA